LLSGKSHLIRSPDSTIKGIRVRDGFENMKILLVGDIDPWSSKPCGIRGYVMGLLKPFLDNNLDVTLAGTTAKGGMQDPGFAFVDVLGSNKKFPGSQAFFDLALYTWVIRMRIQTIPAAFDLVHAQRIDLAFPFVFSRTPVVCTLHGKASEQARDKHGLVTGLLVAFIERMVFSRLNHAIAVSEDIGDYYCRKFPSIAGKLTVIGNGVDTGMFRPIDKKIHRNRFGFDPDEKIILYLGRFHEEKNLPLLLAAFDHLVRSHGVQARLVLIGDGGARDQVLGLVREKNLESVVSVMKPLPDEEVPLIMSCADVYGLSSRVEGFPLVILQALACDVPVVSTDVGEVSRVVIDDRTGYLVQDFSIETFADRLRTVLANPERFRGNCAAMASDFTWESVADKTIGIYHDVIAGRSSPP
jgi:L-malate glycosyltransferase